MSDGASLVVLDVGLGGGARIPGGAFDAVAGVVDDEISGAAVGLDRSVDEAEEPVDEVAGEILGVGESFTFAFGTVLPL